MKQVICKPWRGGSVILLGTLVVVGLAALSAACLAGDEARPPAEKKHPSRVAAEFVPATTSKVKPSAVPTFHCLGVYWSPEEGGAGKEVSVKYRESGQGRWWDGLSMRHNPVDTPECKAHYRGSIVNLKPGTPYEIALHLDGTEIRTVFTASTWSEHFPVASVVKGESLSSTLNVDDSGTPQGYVLYDGTGCTIDTGNKEDVGIAVRGSYVILRGFSIKNVKQHGIRLFSGHHIVIENCDISKWGSEDENGWGRNYQACVFSNQKDLRSVVIQRCKMHHPSWDTNSWAERHGESTHPAGPQTVVFWESEGNHVIRYNECWSDKDHYFNDGMGAGYNGGFRGFPGADSDIYCNYIANCWDDGIEAEGGDQNVRIWNNYMEEVLIPIANAAGSIGPLYAWRNVSGRCYSPPGSSWDMTHGPFFKMGYAGGEKWMTGHMYIFNNTIFQANGEGASGLGGSSRVIKHCVTRNNVFHVRSSDTRSISTGKSEDNDFDYDLLSARYPAGQEARGISGKPEYAPDAGFDREAKTGSFQLAPGSPGYDAAVVIPNFCDVFTGTGPDMGAQEAGTAPMEFGVEAEFVPPGTSSRETGGRWRKHEGNPVLGGDLGTCFDVSVLKDRGEYLMVFSWRPERSVALVRSRDGVSWSTPSIVLGPSGSGWEGRVNRPSILERDGTYHLWYTGQTSAQSFIGYATSGDCVAFKRASATPVLSPTEPWEKVALMCPHVLWDESAKTYRMWYSGGDQYEPNAIGYATSPDGVNWKRHPANPVFKPDRASPWEKHKVTACQVTCHDGWYLMFYIGFSDEHTAHIGMARSRDGIAGWERHPDNPIIAPGRNTWDGDACYKPYAVFEKERNRWLLWYNGRREQSEQIGLAVHDGEDLGWPATPAGPREASRPLVLDSRPLEQYVAEFNATDENLYEQHVSNEEAAAFLVRNVPLLDCPDQALEEIYYFRWWTYRKHIKKTPDGFVVTEFLPKVGWSGKHNTISCPAGHHFYEGRWLRDQTYLDDYATFWFRRGGDPRRYSFWAANALYARHLVHPDAERLVELLDDLVANYEAWEASRLDPNGLFWQIDDRDGMEVSIGGSGYRATINAYQYGDARAIAAIARMAGKDDVAGTYDAKAAAIKDGVQRKLWDSEAEFFKVLPRGEEKKLADVRELHGFTPWYVNLPDAGFEVAWRQLMDPKGFFAPYGPTTAEQRHPGFSVSYSGHECQWNGPSWPYATSLTLVALANLLNDYDQNVVGKDAYLATLETYARSHRLKRADGRVVPWIDENINPYTGDWISRTRLKAWRNGTWDSGKGGKERGKDYNHSTFCDLVITGLIGLRPRDDDQVVVNPLLPPGTWDYFCLDNISYHGSNLTILWDATGRKYGKGQGLQVFADGQRIAAAEKLRRVTGALPPR